MSRLECDTMGLRVYGHVSEKLNASSNYLNNNMLPNVTQWVYSLPAERVVA